MKETYLTINPQKEKVNDRVIANAKNRRVAKIVIPKFSATVQTKPNPKTDSLVIVLGLL